MEKDKRVKTNIAIPGEEAEKMQEGILNTSTRRCPYCEGQLLIRVSPYACCISCTTCRKVLLHSTGVIRHKAAAYT